MDAQQAGDRAEVVVVEVKLKGFGFYLLEAIHGIRKVAFFQIQLAQLKKSVVAENEIIGVFRAHFRINFLQARAFSSSVQRELPSKDRLAAELLLYLKSVFLVERTAGTGFSNPVN